MSKSDFWVFVLRLWSVFLSTCNISRPTEPQIGCTWGGLEMMKCCVLVLLLPNSLPQNLAAYNKHLISEFQWVRNYGSNLAGWAQSLLRDFSQDVGQGFSHLKVSLGLEDLKDLVGFTQWFDWREQEGSLSVFGGLSLEVKLLSFLQYPVVYNNQVYFFLCKGRSTKRWESPGATTSCSPVVNDLRPAWRRYK